jgi:hypothetical protein
VKLRDLLTSAVVAVAVVVPAAPASAASSRAAIPVCDTWSDKNTFGAFCEDNADAGTKFRAAAECIDGTEVRGPWRYVGYAWSYAYCSAHSGLYRMWIQFS